jgi:hypothetical protein
MWYSRRQLDSIHTVKFLEGEFPRFSNKEEDPDQRKGIDTGIETDYIEGTWRSQYETIPGECHLSKLILTSTERSESIQ